MSEEAKKETPKKKPSSMWQRIVTGACLIAVLTLVLCLGGWYFAVAVFLATMLAIHEELNALKVGGHRPVCWTSYVALCLAVPAMRFYSSLAIIPILTVLGFFVVLQVMRREDPDLIDILVSVLPMITYVPHRPAGFPGVAAENAAGDGLCGGRGRRYLRLFHWQRRGRPQALPPYQSS